MIPKKLVYLIVQYNSYYIPKNISKKFTKISFSNKEYLNRAAVFAASLDFWSDVKMLLKLGADISAYNYDIFYRATGSNNCDMVKYLLKNYKLEGLNNYDFSYDMEDRTDDKIPLFDILINHGFKITEPDDLEAAIYYRQYNTVEYLLLRGVKISDSAIIDACKYGDERMVGILLSHGADPNAQDGEPLRQAIKIENKNLINKLNMWMQLK